MRMKSLRNTTVQLIALGSVLTFALVLYAMQIKPHAMSATESLSKNPLHDFELYVRYTTAGGTFPKQAEAWLFRSMSLFWPKNSKVVVVLDKENEADRKYGSTLNETIWNKKLDLRVCYMEPYPNDIIHNWGKMRMYFDMMHADLCTNATYVGLADVDTLFTTAVTPSLLLEDGKPVVTGRIGEPRIPCWIQSGEYVLGVKQVMQCMHYFPVTFKTAHIREFREYVTKLHGKDFKEVVSEATGKLQIKSTCYCHYSMMCNFMWYHHRNEYAWHLQYVKPTRPSNATVPYEYFTTVIKPEEIIPHPRSSQHTRHYMLNGKYMDAKVPSESFVNETLVEGLCYSFGVKLCRDLCKGYSLTRIHVNLFNFENYDWLWDSRCMGKQIEHYQNVSILFDKKFFYLDSREEIGRMGVVVENKSQQCNQLMSCAADGTVLVWDTRPSKSAAPAHAAGQNPAGTLPTFKHLDLTWKPVLRVTVSHVTGAGEFGPSVFSISERQGARTVGAKSSEEKETGGISNLASSISKGRDQGKPLENVSSKFFIGTEEGDLVYMDWKPEKDTDSGKIVSPRPEQVWAAHDGPITTLQRSPFFRDIILTVGGWTFAIWKEGVTSGPLLQSASHLMRLTRGHWSPSRPGVFFITKTDGNVDVWDLLDRSHEPSLTQNVTAAPITTISPHQVSSKQQLLAVGDSMGTLHVMEVPWNLRHPSANEANAMENFFEREVKRLVFVEERMKIREQEKKQLDAEESKRQQEGKRQEESDADVEARQRMEYQEYLQMEKQLLEELGIREETDDLEET